MFALSVAPTRLPIAGNIVVPLVFVTDMMEQVALNKSSLLLKIILQNSQTLQLFAMDIKKECSYKSY
jgi:hypothetical protein